MNGDQGRLRMACFGSIALLAAVEPFTHAWQQWRPPAGHVASGLRINDYAFFLPALRMFQTNFHNPYALCQWPISADGIQHFSLPHHWFYGIAGLIRPLLGLSELMFMGMLAGLAMVAYLWAVYQFLLQASPHVGRLAFLLYCWSGGLGGWMYLFAYANGDIAAPDFGAEFLRFARYELLEGPYLLPVLMGPRPYYTLPLACGFALFAAYIRLCRTGKWHLFAISLPLFCCAMFINMRLAPLFIFAMGVFAVAHRHENRKRIWFGFAAALVASGLGMVAAFSLVQLNPEIVAISTQLRRRSIWLSSFVTATAFAWLLLPRGILGDCRALRGTLRIVAFASCGYLAAFVVVWFVYQILYGSLRHPGDFSAAVYGSDFALSGAVIGGFAALIRNRRASGDAETCSEGAWITVWFLVFVAMGVSAFGQGWYLRLLPERFLVLVGAPMALVAARSFVMLAPRYPTYGKVAVGIVMVSGMTSTVLAAAVFQGPAGVDARFGVYPQFHNEYIPAEDAAAIARMAGGTVLAASIIAGDMVAQAEDTTSVVGLGVQDYGREDFVSRTRPFLNFFNVDTSEEERLALVQKHCIDWVFCPALAPVSPEVLSELRRISWLREETALDGSTVFRVVIQQGQRS